MPFRNLPNSVPVTFHAGETILIANKPLQYLYCITDGIAKRCLFSKNGLESTVFFYFSGGENPMQSLIGGMSFFHAAEDYGAFSRSDVIAVTDVQAYQIPRESFLAHLQSHREELLRHTVDFLFSLYDHSLEKYYYKEHWDNVDLVADFLLQNAMHIDDQWQVAMLTTFSEVSVFLDMHPSTLSKILSKLEKEHIIQKVSRRKIIILDKPALEQLANQDCHLSYRYVEPNKTSHTENSGKL